MALHQHEQDFSLAQPLQDKIQQLLNELDEKFTHRSELWYEVKNPKNRSTEMLHLRRLYAVAAFYMCSRDIDLTAKKTGIKKHLITNYVRDVRETQPEEVEAIENAIGTEVAKYLHNDLVVPVERITASGARGMVEKFDVLAHAAYTQLLTAVNDGKVAPNTLVQVIKMSVEEIRELVKLAQASKAQNPALLEDEDIKNAIRANAEMLKSAERAVEEANAISETEIQGAAARNGEAPA